MNEILKQQLKKMSKGKLIEIIDTKLTELDRLRDDNFKLRKELVELTDESPF
jgi:hypothetical protein